MRRENTSRGLTKRTIGVKRHAGCKAGAVHIKWTGLVVYVWVLGRKGRTRKLMLGIGRQTSVGYKSVGNV